jgi:CRP-like cAMP-binding protein
MIDDFQAAKPQIFQLFYGNFYDILFVYKNSFFTAMIKSLLGTQLPIDAAKKKSGITALTQEVKKHIFKNLIDKLPSFSLFKSLKFDDIHELFTAATIHYVPPETLIIGHGEYGRSVFIILEGNAAVEHETDGSRLYLAKFKRGDFFGEAAFFTDGFRNASIHATAPSIILELEPDILKDLIKKYPEIYNILFDHYKRRSEDLKHKVNKFLKPLRERLRYDNEGEVTFQLKDREDKKGQILFGILLDLSDTGCKIEMDGNQFLSHRERLIGEEMPITLKLKGDITITAIGKVVWFEKATGMDIFGYHIYLGIKFSTLNRGGRDAITRILKKRKKGE